MADIAELIVALKLRDGLSSGLGRLNGQLRGMQGGLSQVGTGIGQVGRGIGQAVTTSTIAVAGLGAAVVTTAASFEQAEAGIRKTVGGTTTEVDGLVESIKQMSREVPLSFEELAAITAEGGALGIANANLVDFTDVVARLGVSTDLTTEQASSALGQLANVLKLRDDDLRDFGDSLVALGNDGASTESQILDMTARFGAAGKQAGLSNEAILALSSTTASMGIEAEAGGGALSRIFNGITIDIATATDESKILADSMGLSLAELRTAWDKDAGHVFQDLLGYIGKLDKFEAAEFLSGLGITNTRDINALTLLASGAEEYGRQLGVAEGQTNELNRESDVFFNTTEGKWAVFKNNVRLAADSLGGQLLPVVNDVMDELIGGLSDPAVQKGLTDFGADLARGVRGLAAELKGTDFSGIIGGMKLAAGVAKAAFDAFRALPEPIQQLAIAALVANKVTGGAVGNIARGLTNIALGALKTINAANVTVIGKNVISPGSPGGGLPGVGGAAGGGIRGAINGGGLIGGLATGVAAASIPLVGVAAVEVVNFDNMRTEGMANVQTSLDNLPRRTGAEIDESIARIESVINEERPLLDGILFNTNVKPQLDAELAELRTARAEAAQNARAHAAAVKGGAFSQINEFRRASNERRTEANQQRSAADRIKAAVDSGRAATNTGFGRTANILNAQNTKLGGILAKKTSVNVNVSNPVTVALSVSAVTQQIIRLQQARVGTGFTEGII